MLGIHYAKTNYGTSKSYHTISEAELLNELESEGVTSPSVD